MKNLGLYDNNLSIPRKQDIEAVKELIPTEPKDIGINYKLVKNSDNSLSLVWEEG